MTDKKWFDKYARHMIDTEFYAEARARRMKQTLSKMERDLKAIVNSYGVIKSKAQERKCLKECDDCIDDYIDEWEKKETKEREKYAEEESRWLAAAIKIALGIILVVTGAMVLRALETPYSDTDTFQSFCDGIREKVKKAVRTPLRSSRIFGTSTSSVSESLDSSFRKIEAGAVADMQTSVTALQRNVQYQLLEDKRRIRLVYVSMLDDRVCAVCAGYSGNVYEDLSKAPPVPVHFRCRCYYLPVLSSGNENPFGENYADWFKRQPDSVKYRILGPTRYNFYKSGLVDVKNFSSGGRKLTLKELFNGKPDSSKSKKYADGI